MSSFLSHLMKPSKYNFEEMSSKYWQTPISNSFEDNQTKINTMQEDSSLLNTKNCDRCMQNPAKIDCKTCGVSICLSCDGFIHSKNKFKLHHRNGMQREDSQSENIYNIRISEMKDNNHSIELQKNLSNLSVTQKWEIIVNQIQNKFNQIMIIMEERKEELMMKLEKKKEEELKYNMEIQMSFKSARRNSHSEESVKRSQMSEKTQTPFSKNKLHECEHADQNGKCSGKYQINASFLNQLKVYIQKIQIKNVLSKIICPVEQQNKKKMRSSMLLNLNSPSISSIFSSGLKSPKSPKLSQSIWVDDPKNITEKVNEQENEGLKMKLKINDMKALQKVKSQKFIMKNKGLEVTSARGRDTKLKKLEIMI